MKVEEIGDLDTDKSKLFKEALANEKEFGLTEQQKTSVIKVSKSIYYNPFQMAIL